jgi:hypothetical protein
MIPSVSTRRVKHARERESESVASAPPCFGPLRLLPANRLLERSGVAVDWGGGALDILITLVRHAGEVAGKTEPLSRVWPDISRPRVRGGRENLRISVRGGGVAVDANELGAWRPIASRMPKTRFWGACLLASIMFGAVATHLAILHTLPAGSVILLLLASIVLPSRRSDVGRAPSR